MLCRDCMTELGLVPTNSLEAMLDSLASGYGTIQEAGCERCRVVVVVYPEHLVDEIEAWDEF